MDIAVVGAGYVGLVTGTCLAELGLNVICVDKDEAKIAALQRGEVPIYETGMQELVTRNSHAGRLKFTCDIKSAINQVEAVFLAVGTPTKPDGIEVDMSFIYQAAEEIKANLAKKLAIIIKSTVPVGTNKQVKQIFAGSDCEVISNPEFLREGLAIYDFMNPERIIIGSVSEKAKELMGKIYSRFNSTPIIYTTPESAELIKYAANGFLATKIAFINEMANLCEKVGADIDVVSHAMGLDSRIGAKFLQAGPGFGGSCFPKDTLALLELSKQHNSKSLLIEATINSNKLRYKLLVDRIIQIMDGSVAGKTLACLGLAFKANTDDVRASPAVEIIEQLLVAGAIINCYDPVATDNAKKTLMDKVKYCHNIDAALQQSAAIVILTEWEEFKQLSASKLKDLRIIDLRNLLNLEDVRASSISYFAIGKV
jgi:UDPglucose 6-dehydrogenase